MKNLIKSRVLCPLSCLFRSKRGKKNKRRLAEDDAASPMSTALMTDDEDLSGVYKDISFLALSSDELSLYALHDDDPCLQFDNEIETLSCSTRGSNIKLRLGWRQRFNKSFHRIVKHRSKTEGDSLLLDGLKNSSYGFDDDGFDNSTFFSKSTNNKKVFLQASTEQVECSLFPSLSASEYDGKLGNELSVSLSKYIESERQDSMIRLGDISTQDSLSVGSACLAVSFDEDYPQLVMQTSHVLDGEDDYVSSASDDVDDEPTSCLLGAAFAHPAHRHRGASVAGQYRDLKSSSKASPGQDDLNELWERIDGGNEGHAPALLAPMDCSPDQPSLDPVRVETTVTSWDSDDEENMRWSFSNEDSVVSFSSVFENQILRSACHDIYAYANHKQTCKDNPSDEDVIY